MANEWSLLSRVVLVFIGIISIFSGLQQDVTTGGFLIIIGLLFFIFAELEGIRKGIKEK